MHHGPSVRDATRGCANLIARVEVTDCVLTHMQLAQRRCRTGYVKQLCSLSLEQQVQRLSREQADTGLIATLHEAMITHPPLICGPRVINIPRKLPRS